MDILKIYQEYAFLPTSPEVEDERSVSQRYDLIIQQTDKQIKRSHEAPCQWYFVVFSPLNNAYAKDPEWFKFKGLSKCRDLFKHPEEVILTREILDCEKIHINALVCCSEPPRLNNKSTYCNKYYANLVQVPGLPDRIRIRDYILKEGKHRTLEKYLDIITYSRL